MESTGLRDRSRCRNRLTLIAAGKSKWMASAKKVVAAKRALQTYWVAVGFRKELTIGDMSTGSE
jgi:hypothetical protein